MALVVYDRVQETTATTGTGAITLGGAVAGYQSFAVVGNGNTTFYCIVNSSAWEVGIGTYSTSGPTLARTTILSNSNGNTSPITLVGASNVFVTYPSERSVNLDASGNVSALGTITSAIWNGTTIPVAYGGTGVTASSGANSVMIRDANQNVSINRLNQSSTTVTAAGSTTTLTAASTFSQILNGTGGQTFKLPDATTLTNTTTFEFNNNATGTLTIVDNASGPIGTIISGGAAAIALLSNGTVGGTWDVHAYIPENVQWGTNSLVLGSTIITGGTWNGGTIASGYGGTGLTTFAAANNALYSTSSSALAAGTLPAAAGGTGVTTLTGFAYGNGTSAFTAATTAQALSLIGTVPIANGGTNSTATPTAGGVGYGTGTAYAYTAAGTSNQVLISNGSSAPSFTTLAGSGVSEFATGTALMFYQATAPTGWTKSTTNDNKALRVVSGATGGSAGGSVAFTTAFASQTPAGTVSTTNTATTAGGSIGGAVDGTAISTAQMPAHNHGVSDPSHAHSVYDVGHSHGLYQGPYYGGGNYTPPGGDASYGINAATNGSYTGIGIYGAYTGISLYAAATGISITNTGSGSSHNHGVTGVSFTGTSHNHTASSSFTGTAINLAVQYIDVIVCTKN